MAELALRISDNQSDLISRIQEIPTLPIVTLRVTELLNDPNASTSQIADLLKKDQVLTSKLLKLANSSYYHIPGGVKDVERAMQYLGFNTVAQLTLSISVFSMFSKIDGDEFTMTDFWRHALGTAICARFIAKKIEHPNPEEVFTCGLLHDVGKLILHELDRGLFRDVVRSARKNEKSFHQIEKELQLPEHTLLGKLMGERWGLPESLLMAIEHHHATDEQIQALPEPARRIVQIVDLANRICRTHGIGKSGNFSKGFYSEDLCLKVGVPKPWAQEVAESVLKEFDRAGAFLNVYR